MNGGVPSKELNKELYDISDQLPSTRDLRNILNQLASNSNLLDNSNCIQHIMFLLGAGANWDTQNRHGKTLSYYLDKRLSDILGWLASDRGKLNDYIQSIISLIQAGADPNVQNQAGKTLLHYVAERNDTEGIGFLLKAGADPNVKDQYKKTPSEYATKDECRQAIEGLGCSSNDKTTCTKLSDPDPDKDQGYYSDDSRENEGNSTTPDGSVDDCSNSSGDDNKTISTEPSDCDPEDEDSSCSSSDYLFLEDSLLAKLEIPLTTDEQELIDKFCEEIRGMTAQNKQESEENILESIEKIVDEYLKEGIRLNSSWSNGNEKGDKENVTSLIFKEMEGVISQLRVNPRSSTAMLNTHDYTDESDGDEYKADEYKTADIIIKRITSNLLLKGGMGQEFLSGDTELTNKHYDFDYLNGLNKQYEDRKEELKSIAYEGIVGRDGQAKKGKLEAVEIDNQYFYVKYSQDSIIEPVKIFNKAEALKDKALNLKVSILQIRENIVRVEDIEDGKRNYTDVLKSSIEMSFTTEVGKINIYLSPSKEGGNKIEVEIDEKNKAKFNKLKDKSSLGKDCLLEGENVSEVISKNFKMSDSVSTELTETTKDVPFTDLRNPVCSKLTQALKADSDYWNSATQ